MENLQRPFTTLVTSSSFISVFLKVQMGWIYQTFEGENKEL